MLNERPSNAAAGHVVYTVMCDKHGGMIDDGTLFRLDTNKSAGLAAATTRIYGGANKRKS